MNFILDTHTYLWVLFEPDKIPKKLKASMSSPDSINHVSIITFWEISLKFALRKIDLKGVFPDELPGIALKDGFQILNLNVETTASFYKLPKTKNKDPFDRMLAWQAIDKNYHLITKDEGFTEYTSLGLKTIW